MKIACQSCQAKYTIADEKVVGKVVKIRCKKCGSTIVVNGQDAAAGGQAAPVEEQTEVGSAGPPGAGADEWTVNVADDDQRTMTTHQIVAEFAKGTVGDETYCWRDGMGDWLPLREIEELAAACGLTQATAVARHSAPPPQAEDTRTNVATRAPASVRPAAAGSGGGAGLFASAAAPVPAAARRAGGRAGGADLFGGVAEAGGENDVLTSAPQNTSGMSADDGKMTGQRNENSVLFSLNALTGSADAKPKPASELVGAAQGDGSGLIDIRALSANMSPTGPKKPNHADDIMNLGGGGAFSAALAAPVLTAPPLDSGDSGGAAAGGNSKMIMMVGGGIAAILIIGMIGIYFAIKPSAPAVATGGPESSGAAPGPTSPGAPPPAATTPSAAAAAPAGADTSGAVAANEPGSKASAPAVGASPKHGGGGGGGGAVAVNTPPPEPVHSTPSGPPAGLDALMAKAAGGGGAPHAEAPPSGGSAPFDRGAAIASLGAIADSVGSCKKPGGPTGEGHVSITFSPSGNVISAIVDQPPFAGTAVGGCVAGKFRGAHVPPFAGGNLPLGKRFTIN